jgi:proton-translocating NAD(P)+ transhydrogenase subunit alpha
MNTVTSFTELYVFVLAAFVGFQVITRVPPLLHTPLMSATNAISGISLVGSLVAAGSHETRVSTILGFIAVTSATINVVGGFIITDRMLKMFKRVPRGSAAPSSGSGGSVQSPTAAAPRESAQPQTAAERSEGRDGKKP